VNSIEESVVVLDPLAHVRGSGGERRRSVMRSVRLRRSTRAGERNGCREGEVNFVRSCGRGGGWGRVVQVLLSCGGAIGSNES
jgi:hypothetical protein